MKKTSEEYGFNGIEIIPRDLNREINEKLHDLIEKKGENNWKCLKCSKTSSWKGTVMRHLETHLNYSHPCPQCDFTARTRRGLKDHYRGSHKK